LGPTEQVEASPLPTSGWPVSGGVASIRGEASGAVESCGSPLSGIGGAESLPISSGGLPSSGGAAESSVPLSVVVAAESSDEPPVSLPSPPSLLPVESLVGLSAAPASVTEPSVGDSPGGESSPPLAQP
jgi:hypothetical protein